MAVLVTPPTVGETVVPARPASRPISPAALVLVTLAALLLVALLNCDELVQLAQRLPYGSQRTIAVDLADVDRDVSRALWLDRPRHALDRLLGHGPAGGAHPVSPVTPSRPAVSSPTPGPSATVGPSRPSATAPPPPSAAHPLRVFLAGDSVGEDVGLALQQLADRSKVVSLDNAARISTGLTRPDYFDWPARLQQALAASQPPQAVVVMVGGNDAQPILTPHGPAGFGTAAWFAEYRRRVAATMAMLTGRGVDVYWIGQPLMQSDDLNRQLGQIDAVFASEAARHAGVTFIDARPLLADANGHYAEYLPGPGGTLVQVRWGDGVHMTPVGAARVAGYLWNVMRHRWALPVAR